MATPAENLQSAFATLTEKLAEATASAAPDITVDGVVINRTAYLKTLTDQLEALRALKAATRKPYYIRSRRRG